MCLGHLIGLLKDSLEQGINTPCAQTLAFIDAVFPVSLGYRVGILRRILGVICLDTNVDKTRVPELPHIQGLPSYHDVEYWEPFFRAMEDRRLALATGDGGEGFRFVPGTFDQSIVPGCGFGPGVGWHSHANAQMSIALVAPAHWNTTLKQQLGITVGRDGLPEAEAAGLYAPPCF